MRRALALFTVVGLISAFVAISAHADVPDQMNYQGYLTDNAGDPVPDGNYSLTFRLYTVPAGGSAFWSEGQLVSVTGGLFDVQLGAGSPLDAADFDGSTLYLGIQVGGDPELTPRTKIVSYGYAFRAATADQSDSTATAPGVSQLLQFHSSTADFVNGFSVYITSDSITAPEMGYAMVEATMTLYAYRPNTTTVLLANVQLRDSTVVATDDQTNLFGHDGSSNSVGYTVLPVNIHRVFPV